VRPALRRDVVAVLQGSYRVSERRACSAMGFHRSAQRYRSRRDPQVELRMRLRDLAAVRVRDGYRRLHVLLRREGWLVNHKRIYRLYAEEGLSIRTKLPGASGPGAAVRGARERRRRTISGPWTPCRTGYSTAARSVS
jgi:putative transposase